MTASKSLNGKDMNHLSILYVEDDEDIREQLAHFLKRRVGTLYIASNGKEGLESFRAHQPDIVVSDVRMPIMDGLDMADAIKHEHPGTPVIITTAFNEADYFLKAIDIGVDKYVMKPIKTEALVEAINSSAHVLQAERNLHLAATVFDTTAEGIIIADASHKIVSINPTCTHILGYPPSAISGFHLSLLADDSTRGDRQGVPWEQVLSRAHWHGEAYMKRRDGDVVPVLLSANMARDEQGNATHHVLVFMSIVELKQREAEITELNATLETTRQELERRVEERTWDLVAARDTAETANRAKSQFLSQMSHELRTPMNAILGFTELLHTDTDAPLTLEQKEHTTEILRAGRHLLDLINDVLDLAKVESGKFSLNLESVPIQEVFQDCLDMIRPLAGRRRIQVDYTVSGNYLVKADKTRIRQVFINLLSNAVKYNRDGGHIGIECHATPSDLRLGISDTGEGISEADKPHLFKPFERFGPSKHFQEGTGIGLALTQRLVELMGGTIAVDSVPGQGSTFWVQLELSGEDPAGQPKAKKRPPVGEAYLECLNGRSVLYVEDNPTNLRFMQSLFDKLPDTRLLTAARADEGLGLALTERPDFIILDIGLPDMSGYDLLSYLRDDPALDGTPIVALSANAMPEDLERGREAGFAEYLTKPVHVDRLLATIKALLCDGPPA